MPTENPDKLHSDYGPSRAEDELDEIAAHAGTLSTLFVLAATALAMEMAADMGGGRKALRMYMLLILEQLDLLTTGEMREQIAELKQTLRQSVKS